MISPRSIPWLIFGREIRPGAASLSYVNMLAAIGQFTGATLLHEGPAIVVGVIAVSAASCLMVGWWAQSSRAMNAGLMMSVWLWTALSTLILIENPLSISGLLGIGWSALAALLWLRIEESRMV